jgi:hypothetical protein
MEQRNPEPKREQGGTQKDRGSQKGIGGESAGTNQRWRVKKEQREPKRTTRAKKEREPTETQEATTTE